MIVQPGGVYGPGDTSSVGDLLDQFFAGKMPLMPFPELGICLTHVEDIAAGIILGLDKGTLGEAYVISGPATTMREAIEIVAEVTGRKAPKRALPTPLMKALTPIGPLVGKMMGQPPNLRELISSADGVTFWASYDKAERELGYHPRGLEEGLRADARGGRRFLSSCLRSRGGLAVTNCGRFRRVLPDSRRLPPMRVIDVVHLGRPHVIGCWEVDGALVDPGPESSLQTVLEALGERAAGGDPAHPHPPRPRRRDRGAGAALARSPGLRARARRAAPDRPLEAAGQRRAPLRGSDGAALGRDRAGPGGAT